MKKAIRKLVKGVTAFGLIAIAVVAFASTAFATGSPGEFSGTDGTSQAEPKITKRIRMPEGIANIPASTYTFEFEPLVVEDKAGETSPNINNNTTDMLDDNEISITFGANLLPGSTPDSDGYMYLDRESENILADTVFTHAGIYVYNVTEKTPNTPIAGMTYSQAKYKMRVYVDNDSPSGVYVKYVTFNLLKDNGAGSEEKAAPLFTNTYTKNTSFVIDKTVAGSYADKGLDFTYKITLWNAPGATATAYNASKTEVKDPLSVTANATGESSPTEYTFTLKHGEQLKFDNIPVGTKYKLTEEGSANYTASVTVSDGNAQIGTVAVSNKNTALTIGDLSAPSAAPDKLKSPIVLTDKNVATNDNKAVWTNNYVEPPTPTGIFMDNLPFILMIVIAISGFTGYIVMKRRSRRV